VLCANNSRLLSRKMAAEIGGTHLVRCMMRQYLHVSRCLSLNIYIYI
jgi:hypothetical protein